MFLDVCATKPEYYVPTVRPVWPNVFLQHFLTQTFALGNHGWAIKCTVHPSEMKWRLSSSLRSGGKLSVLPENAPLCPAEL